MKRTRKNIKLESEVAGILFLGFLLLTWLLAPQKITAFKTYTNFPGNDLIATNAGKNTSAGIQI